MRTSIFMQTGFLFLLSFLVIITLWPLFYFQQKYQHSEYDAARYFNTASLLQPLLMQKKTISEQMVAPFSMRLQSKESVRGLVLLDVKGTEEKGFRILQNTKAQFLHVYNSNGEVFLEDISTHRSMVAIHLVFLLLLLTQALLYMALEKSLSPLASLHKTLKKLETGEFVSLKIDTQYEEIAQMIASYNTAVSKIQTMLEQREMFNKIFMHEMKMPLAKGMFYLKQTPSSFTHEKLQAILQGINEELEEYSHVESLLGQNSIQDRSEHKIEELIHLALKRLGLEKNAIELKVSRERIVKGDKELWVLCFKNLIDNALKYAIDKKLSVFEHEGLCFVNKAEPLPVDISSDVKRWKIPREKRHKSSTGYGFGLFIIKNIIILNGYKLAYKYDTQKQEVCIRII